MTPITSDEKIIEFPGERRVGATGSHWPSQAERRVKFRYPLDLTVRFRDPSAGSSGEGLAVNLSSGGVLVASHHQIALGSVVEMSIEWPLLLNGETPLQLIAVGRVLRRGAYHFAAKFERHEFRTMKSSL